MGTALICVVGLVVGTLCPPLAVPIGMTLLILAVLSFLKG